MANYQDCCEVERRGKELITPLLRMYGEVVSKDNDAAFQQAFGDFLFYGNGPAEPEGKRSLSGPLKIELKTEEEDLYGNIFAEDWSNLDFHRRKPGWMMTLQSDILVYVFLKGREAYFVRFDWLWEWLFVSRSNNGRRAKWAEFEHAFQGKTEQLNRTHGIKVPISAVGTCVGYRRYECDEYGQWAERKSKLPCGIKIWPDHPGIDEPRQVGLFENAW